MNKTTKNPSLSYPILPALLGMLVMTFLFLSCEIQTAPISRNRLGQMLENQDIERLAVMDGKVAHIYIKAEKLGTAPYQDLSGSTGSPHYKYVIGSLDNFFNFIADQQTAAGIPEQNQVFPEMINQQSWLPLILNWLLPPLIILLLILAATRFASMLVERRQKLSNGPAPKTVRAQRWMPNQRYLITIDLKDDIKMPLYQYLLLFRPYIRQKKGKEINYDIIHTQSGIDLSFQINDPAAIATLNDWYAEYMGHLGNGNTDPSNLQTLTEEDILAAKKKIEASVKR